MLNRKLPKNKNWTKIIILFVIIFSIFGTIQFLNFSYLNKIESQAKESIEKSQLSIKKSRAIVAKRNESVYIELPGTKKVRAIVDDYTKPDSVWVLVNKTNPLPIEYRPSELKIPNVKTRTDKSDDERSVRSDIEKALIDMFLASEKDGYYLMIGSGYRSSDLQSLYFYSLANSVGEVNANQSIARPGQSEHQTGLSVDISTISQECYLSECFATTGDGLWLLENSYKFGFILRFPKDKESITGYNYEPWHFRYVGAELATAIHESGLTFEEVWPYLEKALEKLKSNGAIK